MLDNVLFSLLSLFYCPTFAYMFFKIKFTALRFLYVVAAVLHIMQVFKSIQQSITFH